MDQLRFTGVHEDGAHVVLTSDDGTDYVVPIDDRLRAALRPVPAVATGRATPATPREVQTHIRAGASAEEVCEGTGWSVERVRRFEGPILAEREHMALLARGAQVRTHERAAPAPTLEARVRDRLQARGVNLDQVSWDSTRPDGGQWAVVLRFMAGQRVRQASWVFDPSTRSVEAHDDEARWLSEDEQSLPVGAAGAALFGGGMDGPDDVMSTIRERSHRRGYGGNRGASGRPARNGQLHESGPEHPEDAQNADGSRSGDPAGSASDMSADPTAVPGRAEIPPEALALEPVSYDPDTMGLPPAAGRRSSPADSSQEGTAGDVGHDGTTADERDPKKARKARATDSFSDDRNEPQEDLGDGRAVADVEVDPASAPGPRGRKGRPKVPSWDDVMFGARDRDS